MLRLNPNVHALRMNAGLTLRKDASGNRRAIKGVEPGTPDILVMLCGGRVLWLECKTEKGKLTQTQQLWHEQAARLGHTAIVVRSLNEAVQAVDAARTPELFEARRA